MTAEPFLRTTALSVSTRLFCPLLMGFLVFLLAGCAPWRDSFLEEGKGTLTQTMVREKLGKPHKVKDPILTDETTWMYRFTLTESELDPLGIKTFGKQAGGLFGNKPPGGDEKIYCYTYTLTFDKEEILRHWEREECQLPKPPDPFQEGLTPLN